MNEFIELRNRYIQSSDSQSFPLVLLKNFATNQKVTQAERQTINKLQSILKYQQQRKLNVDEMLHLLHYLGDNVYINTYITDIFIQNKELFAKHSFGEKFLQLVQDEKYNELIVYSLLDSCIECDYPLVETEFLSRLLTHENLTLDNLSLIIDYIAHFQIKDLPFTIAEYLNHDYPKSIKIQLLDLYMDCYAIDELKELDFAPTNQQWISHYIETIEQEQRQDDSGFTVLQSMFYGDFENSGKGNNGGLAIFLKTLGTALAKNEKIDRVVTLTITDKWSTRQSLVKYYNNKHLFISLPLYVDKLNPTDFLKKQHFIKRTIARFLKKLGLAPDVFHVRFLDNASKAIAMLAKEQQKKLVVTLTPDPHRNMTNQTGLLATFSFDEFIVKLNKIIVGEELIINSDKIVGIGNHIVREELAEYFPQIAQAHYQDKTQMISEGIQVDVNLLNKAEPIVANDELNAMGFTKEFLERPILLNVGRLNRLKAQDQLLKAWGNSALSEVYNLLIIGGDIEDPSPEEEEMLTTFNDYLEQNPHLRNNFLHLGALSNYQIRQLEQKIRTQQKDYPQIYLCSSQKEEFGIAILEAMSQELLVIGPIKGGVKSYLKEGVNGFLIDTSDWQNIADATLKVVEVLKGKQETFEDIQHAGRQTVANNFSMETIVQDFSTLYLSLQE